MAIDLHIHSIYSDGSQTPAELVAMAAKKKLLAISLTDHDTMAGVPEAMQAGQVHGVEVISGLEISAVYGASYLHILGYGMKADEPALVAGLARLQKAREERNYKIVNKIVEMGHPLTMEEVYGVSKVGQTGRPHIAKVLVSHGVVKDMATAFEKFLKRGAPAYVSRFVYDAADAIAMIKKADGLAVLAHPVQIDPNLNGLQELIDDLVAFGLDGIELYYPTQSAKIRKKMKGIAEKYRLLYTGGSDYHGDIRPGSHLAGGKNVRVPEEVLHALRQRLTKKHSIG